jgi:Tfp pilus assembly protein FimT
MRKAFSMVELIFIIVLMGILAKVGSGFIPDNKLLNDTNYISMKIKEAQKNAIGYDTFRFGQTSYWVTPTQYAKDFNLTCIESTKQFLENVDGNQSYILTAKIDNNVTFCFDSIGRPYDKNTTLKKNVDVIVRYNNKTNTISVLPMSGYVIIK